MSAWTSRALPGELRFGVELGASERQHVRRDVDADDVEAAAHQRHQHAPAAAGDFEHSPALSAGQLEIQRQVAVKANTSYRAGKLSVGPGLLGLYERAVQHR